MLLVDDPVGVFRQATEPQQLYPCEGTVGVLRHWGVDSRSSGGGWLHRKLHDALRARTSPP
jgi:hypothetical protein